MNQFATLTEDELDEKIRQLEEQLAKLHQKQELPIEDLLEMAISEREKYYAREVKRAYVKQISKISTSLKKEIAFTTVCNKYFSEQFVQDLVECFKHCHKNSNWLYIQKLRHKAKKDYTPETIPPIDFLCSFYKRFILNYSWSKVIVNQKTMSEKYSDIFSDLQSTKAFSI